MIEHYPQLKTLHMALAALSVSGFVIRFVGTVRDSALMDHKLTRTLPHVIDTLLLLAGLSLVLMSQQYPWVDAWLGVKLFLLLFYIGFGALALKRGQTTARRWLFFGGAVAVVTQMAGTAMRHSPWGWFA